MPAAGVTHAASGIGEAFLDGIPMLVIAGGMRRDLGRAYQLHDMDQHALLAPITKGRWRVERHADVIPVIHEAYRARDDRRAGPGVRRDPGRPPAHAGRCGRAARVRACARRPASRAAGGRHRARGSASARGEAPAIFCGWGAVDATAELIAIAELLGAPVSTTLQGLSAFPANHRLHAGFALGRAAVPAVENAFSDCDALLAVGTRFAEIPTGSYGWEPPANLVHVDINPQRLRRELSRGRRARGRRAGGARAASRRARRGPPSPRARTRSPRRSRRTSATTARNGWRTIRRTASIRSGSSPRCARGCRTTASWSRTTATTRSWSPS